MKTKYFQLLHKDGKFQRLISASQSELDKLNAQGWTAYGFDNSADMPINPIVDGSSVREMTAAELQAQAEAKETEYQSSKTIERKTLDNYALSLIDSLNTDYPSLSIVSTDTVESVTTRAIQQNVTFTDVSKLLTLKEVVGKSRLPITPHTIEET